jgi:hypothetical protein
MILQFSFPSTGATSMTLSSRLVEYISAAFSAIWIQSHEHQDAISEIAQMCRQQDWRLAVWNLDQGLQILDGAQGQAVEAGTVDPLAAIRSLNALASPDSSAILVLVNFHRLLQSAEIVQALAQQVATGKTNRTFIIILSPVVQIPCEIERAFCLLEHDLPDRQQLESIARGIATEEGELPEGAELQRVLDAAGGLTHREMEDACCLSLVRNRRIEPSVIWELKSQMLKKSGFLTLHQGGERFADLGGLNGIKDFCQRALRPDRPANVRPRGVILLGVPGSGKTKFACALGNETGRPTLILDPRGLYGSLLGQTEQNLRHALRVADAIGGILFVDELRDALAGGESSGRTDGGVTAGVLGTLQTWLARDTRDVFFIGSCNSLVGLPPQFTRAGRFNATFFFDYPDERQRDKIWPLYLQMFGLDPQQPRPKDHCWTGAEIRQCCENAALLGLTLVEAAKFVIPVHVSGAEENDKLRQWANGRCLSADMPGIYQYRSTLPGKPGRKVLRGDPSSN